MPALKNPLQMSQIVSTIRSTVTHARQEVQNRAHQWAESQGIETKYLDISIHFIGAKGLPKMDVMGTADPYFHAKLENELSFVYASASEFLPRERSDFAALQIICATKHAQPSLEREMEHKERPLFRESPCRGHG